MSDEAKEVAAKWWSKHLPQENRGAFEIALCALLPDGDWGLYNDYDPDELLIQAVRVAGLKCRGFMFSGKDLGFPEKSGLDFYGGVLREKVGYGAEYKQIWPANAVMEDAGA